MKRLNNLLTYQAIIFAILYLYLQFHPLFPYWNFLVLFAGLALFKKHKIQFLTLFSVLNFIIFTTDFEAVKHGDVIHKYSENLTLFEKSAALLALFIIFYLSKELLIYFKKKFQNVSSSLLVLLFVPLLSLLTYTVSKFIFAESLGSTIYLLPVLMTKSVWFFYAYFKQREPEERPLKKIFSVLQIIPPFIYQRFESREVLDLKYYLAKDSTEELELAKRGAFLVIRGLCVVLALEWLGVYMLNEICKGTQVQTEAYTSFEKFFLDIPKVYSNLSVMDIWISLLYSCFDFLFSTYYGYFGIFIGMAKLAGFKFTESTNYPWRATSFGDFCWRFMYYYSLILTNYFYYPLLGFFSRFKIQIAQRKSISLFFAITIGGFYFHLINDYYYLLHYNFFRALFYYAKNFLPLFATLSLFITIGERFKFRHSATFKFFMINFFIYSLISSLRLVHKFDNADSVYTFYLKLFGIS